MILKNIQDKFYIQSDNKDLFKIFKFGNNIDWGQVSVLDYGCNQGNYVRHAKPTVSPDRYLGVDINQASITQAKKNHPDYQFLHYDQWHPSYNPDGDKNIFLTDCLTRKFDVVIAYSVFTHTPMLQTCEQLADLKKLLNPGGCILATFWHIEVFPQMYKIIRRKHNLPNYNCNPPICNQVFYWLDRTQFIIDQANIDKDSCINLDTFYKPDTITRNFKGSELIGALPMLHVQWLYKII
ncbi:hypothetical protein CCP3SC1AL1_620017 [Gammaproteobacteria bacterium]